MGYKGKPVPGEIPGYGAIFMSSSGTKKECFQRKLFGLPVAQYNFVLHVKKGMYLFLFDFERRQLHGVFRATSNGEINIEPNAFRSSGKSFPAQVPFTSVWNCHPLAEHEFKDAIRDNYYSWKKFKFGLSKDQVDKLMMLFRSKRISKNDPAKTCLRYDDKPPERDTRFGDNRKKVRDRIKFIKEEDTHGFDFDEVKEVDNHGYRTLMKERAQKDKKVVFFKKCKKESNDFGDRGFRKLDKCIDRSLRGSRRMSDASFHNFPEINGITNLEKIKGKHDIEDGYRRFGKTSVARIDENSLVDGNANKNNKFRDDYRIKDEYQVINGFSQNRSAQNDLCSPDRGSQEIVDGWFFRHGTVKSQQRTLTDQPLSKPKGVSDICQNPNHELKTSPFEPRGADLGIKFGSDEEFDLGNVVPNCYQNNSDFIPLFEVSEQFHHPCECGLPYSTSYDPEVPDFCHRPSYFNPGPGSSPIEKCPIHPSETIPYHSENKGPDPGKFRSKHVHKASVFDRLHSAPKALKHEQELESNEKSELISDSKTVKDEQELKSDEKSELHASVNKVMKMLEKIVSSPMRSTEKMHLSFKQDDDDDDDGDDNVTPSKIVDYELPRMESDGSILEETRVVDFKCHKKANKNFDDESKEITAGNTSETDSDVGTSCKRRKLVRLAFVRKESTCMQPTFNEDTHLKADCYLTTVERLENIEDQKGTIEGEVRLQVEENENAKNSEVPEKQSQDKCGFDDMAAVYEKCGFDDWAPVYLPVYDHKMCGWIEE